jgi:hypothetical protein
VLLFLVVLLFVFFGLFLTGRKAAVNFSSYLKPKSVIYILGAGAALGGIFSQTNQMPSTQTPQMPTTQIVVISDPSLPPTPTPDPFLFSDDFEDGIDPTWGIIGEGYSSSNGKLVVGDDGFVQSGVVGDTTWQNYRVTISGLDVGDGKEFSIAVRAQDQDNFIAVTCGVYFGGSRCAAYDVIDAQWNEIPGTRLTGSVQTLSVEVEGNIYSYIANGETVRFVHDAYNSGGILMKSIPVPNLSPNRSTQIESIEVEVLPASE